MELRNLELAFAYAAALSVNQLEPCANLLGIRQVFTIPPQVPFRGRRTLTGLIKALFFLPLGGQVYIVALDRQMSPLGFSRDPCATPITLGLGIFLALSTTGHDPVSATIAEDRRNVAQGEGRWSSALEIGTALSAKPMTCDDSCQGIDAAERGRCGHGADDCGVS